MDNFGNSALPKRADVIGYPIFQPTETPRPATASPPPMSFVFLLIFWLTSPRAGGPVPGPVDVGLHAGSDAQGPAVAPGAAWRRRPVERPGQGPTPATDQREATTPEEEDSQDSEICGGHPHSAFELLIVLGGPGALGSSGDLVGLSRCPSRSPRLRC